MTSKKRGLFAGDSNSESSEPDAPIVDTESPPEPQSAFAAVVSEAAEAVPPPPFPPPLPMVDIGVFCAVSGMKPDQLRGFQSWVRREKIQALSVPQWREMFEKFQKRAV